MSADGLLALVPGSIFHERYRVVRRIKAGGMGAVYEVVDDRTNSPRALKVMLPSVVGDADLRARFALEAKVTGAIATDHIVRVSDAGIDEPTETPFLVMDLLEGEELGSLLKKRGPLPPAEVVYFLHQTALALDKTHAAGIVHRDLKPDNLFVTYRDDGSPCVKILDFGIAKVVAQGTAHTTRAIGTPIYMAPEQICGQASIGPRTDLLALGQIAYTLLTGEPYWHQELKGADSVFPMFTQIVEGLPEAPTARAQRRHGIALPPRFDAWMAQAVAVKPEDRFDRATAQVAALAEVFGAPLPRAPLSSLGAPPAPSEAGGALLPPGYGSDPQAGVAVVSAAAPTRRAVRPTMALVLVAAAAIAVVVVLVSHRTFPGATAASAVVTADPPRAVASAAPASVTSAVPMVEPAGTASGSSPPVPSALTAKRPEAAAPRPTSVRTAGKPPVATTAASRPPTTTVSPGDGEDDFGGRR